VSFLHPQIAAASLGLALLPLVIHIISRRRYRVETWAAMEFLLAAHERTRRKLRVEQWVLMVVRCMVLLLLGLAVARPYTRADALGLAVGRPRCDRVIILDDSLSMQARRPDGSTAFEAARRNALEWIESGGGDGLAVLTASTFGRTWMRQPVHDPAAVRRIVEPLACGYGMDDLGGALSRAAEILSSGDAPPGGRQVCIISDLARPALDSLGGRGARAGEAAVPGQPAAPRPAGVNLEHIDRITLVDVGGRRAENLSLSGLRCRSTLITTRLPARFEVSVAHPGGQSAARATVTLRRDGNVVRRLRLGPIEPGGEASEEFELSLERAGLHHFVAELEPSDADFLPADDRRHLVVNVVDRPSLLLVEGRPLAAEAARELFYYRLAVSSPEGEEPGGLFRSRTIEPESLLREVIGQYAAVVLGNAAHLPKEAWRRLETYVREGGGIVLFLGDQVRPGIYNGLWAGSGSGGGLLPLKLAEWVETGRGGDGLRLGIADAQHPVLAELAGHEKGGLLQAAVWARWRPVEGSAAAPARTLLKLSDGEPAIVTSELGAGRVVTCLFGAGMAAANLAAKPDYVPLMLNLTSFAAGASPGERPLRLGERLAWREPSLAPGAAGEVLRPDGRVEAVDVDAAGGGPGISYDRTDQPGFYQCRVGGRRADFAANVEASDSDLHSGNREQLAGLFGDRVEFVESGRPPALAGSVRPPREGAGVVAAVVLVILVSEMLMAWRFGRVS
jgi:hypothetical protein